MSNYTLNVLVHGKPVKQYNHQGKIYIEGRDGTEYSLEIKNHTFKRILAVPAIDGVNVLTGKPASPTDTGYIVNPYGTISINGFRIDNNSVGAFKFCSKSKSYCNTKGLAGNNGVIGVVIFEEKEKEKVYFRNLVQSPIFTKSSDYTYSDNTTYGSNSNDSPYLDFSSKLSSATKGGSSRSLCSVSCCTDTDVAPKFDTGTGWGSKKVDSVTTVMFETGPKVAELVLYYASKSALQDIGISFKEPKPIAFPSAFPGFATPPKGWRG